MAVLQEYKCPCCGGAIQFNSEAQKMKCPYCDTEFEMDTLKSYDESLKDEKPEKLEWETSAGGEWEEGETDGLRVYSCQSCGGQIFGDETLGATKCPYCDNPVVMMGQFTGSLKPDYVIPFKVNKETAIAALQKHYKKKTLLPRVFKNENHIEEVKGVYVPVWLFDAGVDARINYKGTRTRTWSDSNYRYRETKYYSVIRGGRVEFGNVPVDGSSKMDDTLMESIEPFDFSAAVNFQTAYLAGYLADKYDVDDKQSIGRANERIKRSTEQAFSSTCEGYGTLTAEKTNIQLHNSRAKYALYPVWLLNTRWKDKTYFFAMNGQTGKFVGDLPADKSLATKWFMGVFALTTAAVFLLEYLAWLA